MAGNNLKQEDWEWFQNDASEPITSLAAQNVAPTLADNASVIRLRIGVKFNKAILAQREYLTLEYSTDDVNFTSITGSTIWLMAGASSLSTDGAVTTTFKTTSGTIHGNYHNSSAFNDAWNNNLDIDELDYAIIPNGVAPNTTYYFRLFGTIGVTNDQPVQLDVAKSHPSLVTATNVVNNLGGGFWLFGKK